MGRELRERILCTSHFDPKYREKDGVNVIKYLRDHLTQSSCVIGVLTPNSINSRWCMLELGGAWARAKRTYCVIAGEVSLESIPVLKDADAAQLTEPEEIRRLLANLRRALGWDKRVRGSAAEEINDLVYLASRAQKLREEQVEGLLTSA